VNGWYDGTRESVARLFAAGMDRGAWPPGGFDPPYSDAYVERFEATHDVRLPDEYRSFIMGVGAAGAGPGCGLMSLDRDRAWDDGDVSVFDNLRSAFPWTQRYMPWPQATGDESIDSFTVADRSSPTWSYGLLPIATYAGRARACLVVTGKLHGRVLVDEPFRATYWFDDEAAKKLHGPLDRTECGLPLRFAEWYLDWLEATLKGSVSR
jgi:hypothetical protein